MIGSPPNSKLCTVRYPVFIAYFQESSSGSSRESPTRASKKKPTVVFTGYEDKGDEKSVKEMGGFVTAAASDAAADVLVTDRVRRTAKFMCAMARGMPVVGPAWIAQSKMTKTFLGETQQLHYYNLPSTYVFKQKLLV